MEQKIVEELAIKYPMIPKEDILAIFDYIINLTLDYEKDADKDKAP